MGVSRSLNCIKCEVGKKTSTLKIVLDNIWSRIYKTWIDGNEREWNANSKNLWKKRIRESSHFLCCLNLYR